MTSKKKINHFTKLLGTHSTRSIEAISLFKKPWWLLFQSVLPLNTIQIQAFGLPLSYVFGKDLFETAGWRRFIVNLNLLKFLTRTCSYIFRALGHSLLLWVFEPLWLPLKFLQTIFRGVIKMSITYESITWKWMLLLLCLASKVITLLSLHRRVFFGDFCIFFVFIR